MGDSKAQGSPAEGLRQQIRKELFWITRGTLQMADNIRLNSEEDEANVTFGKLDAQYYHQQYGEDDGSYRTKESEDAIMELVTAYAATVEREVNGCPCLLVIPCNHACSCANPVMSGGCMRCCKYGSLAQRVQSADRLAALQGPIQGDAPDHSEPQTP